MRNEKLIKRVQEELELMEESVNEALASRAKYNQQNDRHFMDAAVLHVHGFYLGVERIFAFIAKKVDKKFPEGAKSHRDLLEQMTENKKGLRPAVVGDELKNALDEYRKFYHVIHHVYGAELEYSKVNDRLDSLKKTWVMFEKEVTKFLDFLKK